MKMQIAGNATRCSPGLSEEIQGVENRLLALSKLDFGLAADQQEPWASALRLICLSLIFSCDKALAFLLRRVR